MSFDGIVTRAVCLELDHTFSGGRVSKIYQPHQTDLILVIRSHGANRRLLISAGAQFTRLHITKRSADNPSEPPMFCMLLRKHLEGNVIESIEQDGFERIVHINLRGKNDIGDVAHRRLIIELMGKHSNIILVDQETGKIIDAIKRLSPAVNRHRTVLPGQPYVLPPDQHKLDPLETTEEDLLRRLDFNAGKLDRQLVQTINGFSPLLATEIISRAGLPNQDAVLKAFSEVQTAIQNEAFHPQIIHRQGAKDQFHVLALSHLDGEPEYFDSPSDMLETFFALKSESDIVRQRAANLSHWVHNEKKKNERKLGKLKDTLKEAEGASRYQLYGELVTAHMHMIKKGDRKIEAVNYYDENQETVTIELDPHKSPSENAQLLFKKYNKLKTAQRIVEEQIAATLQEIEYLDALSQQIESAGFHDIEEIREELEEGGYLRARGQKHGKKKKKQKPSLEHYTSSEGVTILVGKNNKQNEYLTTRHAASEDTWLHTKDIPGSHVVIKGNDFSEKTLVEAATLAAYFSKSSMSSRVPVDYTLIKHVHKPNGAKPGYVIYDHQKTVFVTPDERLVLQLKDK
ncbi:putative ribosome quality control (RQC) complex YloA/Tae2 family protein [Pullulanibacillus pueri]|uniref:Rqc2 homolog RqcH n=1 Tax=Pullulanibacillus pueri TaxID=1437324 RepID=A0A8J3EJZ0_9BACL|nr:NFACT RNA binding domain-containing protein [Pullulanibacillus pueri]MBM7680174.1 putative ribosome quality control (RQC) complex YloA/Tae2 family protein [Pullulanibacillus pueri]GGH74720.1 hypothetical protein GCM10007096_03230 [Pullulanibacillus pueri]